MNSNHSYFKFVDQPRVGVIPQITKDILDFYSKRNLSKKKWVKEPAFIVKYQVKEGDSLLRESISISYSDLARSMHFVGKFSSEDWNLPKYECFWLDNQITMSINFHKFDEGSSDALTMCIESPKQMYGEGFPISPKLDREGHAISSMQGNLVKRIVDLRKKLVEESDRALTMEWIFDLRTLISDAISLVEITLHQIYTKAEYDPLPDWVFDRGKLGEKHGRRMTDKLRWIGQITGKPLDNARDEVASVDNLRRIRNHMMHFDPPCLVVPLEEVGLWLNQVLDVAFLLEKIRTKLDLPISTSIANFMLQKDVVFEPESSFQPRLPLDSRKAGYLSSCWPEEQADSSSSLAEELAAPLEQVADQSTSKLITESGSRDSTNTANVDLAADSSQNKTKGFGSKRESKQGS